MIYINRKKDKADILNMTYIHNYLNPIKQSGERLVLKLILEVTGPLRRE